MRRALALGGFRVTIIDCGLVPHYMGRSRSRRARNYPQVFTGTQALGITGSQIHLAEVTMLDPAIRGAFLKNVQFAVQLQSSEDFVPTEFLNPSFTVYLSYAASGNWSDDAVISAKTVVGGGNGSLRCSRYINTSSSGSVVAEQLGPVQVWIESTDVPLQDIAGLACRYTLTIWGRMIKFG